MRILLILSLLATTAFGYPIPENEAVKIAPGSLCSTKDRDFKGHNYPEKIAICKRNVSAIRKTKIKQKFKVPQEQWRIYQIDHVISLQFGGDNSDKNLMPLDLTTHAYKSTLEEELHQQLMSSKITQQDVITAIKNWYHRCVFQENCENTK